jgi:hypothetical protein
MGLRSMTEQSYTIMISERQREHIEAALTRYCAATKAPGNPTIDEFEASPVVLRDMFKELPKNEAEHPGTLHGFCL